ncbi:MAG: DUF4011 domain-containing protein [Syntrophorhabdus sp.]|nr:DUF4011 domain-containing protein [Syntrophorhabdus sp.]
MDSTAYQAADANEIVSELFSGKLPIQEAIRRLRVRLLDLTSRNRLLSYRYPKNRSVQFAGVQNLDTVFDKIIDGKALSIKWVPEPEPLTVGEKRPDAKQYAESLGIDVSMEAPVNGPNHRNISLQALHYPVELERLLKKISTDAKSSIEETGSNILFLIFGFLEFYEDDASQKPMFAPIISVPVSLERIGVDPETRIYTYVLNYTGEDVAENQTLREKLRQDFSLIIPELEDEDTPETYFQKIHSAVANKRRWRIRRQLTLGMLSFGKLAIWADLDDNKWPGLIKHPLLNMIFEGGSTPNSDGFSPEDYTIDKVEEANQPLVYDADSSQHSAIIDVLAGKNMVINGPPGTGKSQTITNIIAAVLAQGKKVLFVSEKLAALEVVQRRLQMAGLGDFCLELHSNKTQKKKFVEALDERISRRFRQMSLHSHLAQLSANREKLARYAELMGSYFGNELGKTVNEIFWAVSRRRQDLGECTDRLSAASIQDMSQWSHEDLQKYRSVLEEPAKLFPTIGCFGPDHPWWGFYPRPIIPGDEHAIAEILLEATEHADTITESIGQYRGLGGEECFDEAGFEVIRSRLATIPDIPVNFVYGLLSKFFAPEDLDGSRAGEVLNKTFEAIYEARRLTECAAMILVPNHGLTADVVTPLLRAVEKNCLPEVVGGNPGAIITMAESIAAALASFEDSPECESMAYRDATEAYQYGLEILIAKLDGMDILDRPLGDLEVAVNAVLQKHDILAADVQKMQAVIQKGNLTFDGTPASAKQILTTGIRELRPGTKVSAEDLVEARRLCEFPLSSRTLQELQETHAKLRLVVDRLEKSFSSLKKACNHLRIEEIEGTELQLLELQALAQIAARAPQELLAYRKEFFGQPVADQLVDRLHDGLAREASWRGELESLVYLDTLPPIIELRSHLRTLRQGSNAFSFLRRDYRQTKKAVKGISRAKKKYNTTEWAGVISNIIRWVEHRENLVSDPEFRECIGPLFCGLETNISKVRALRDWYKESHQILLEQPSLTEKMDLTSCEAARIGQLAVRANGITEAVTSIFDNYAQAEAALEASIFDLENAKRQDCTTYISALADFSRQLGEVLQFFSRFVDQIVSPKNALQHMKAAAELSRMSPELTRLSTNEEIAQAAGTILPFMATPTIGSWFQHLPVIEANCRKIERLTDYLKAFPRNTTAADALISIKAKLALDDSLKDVSLIAHTLNDWPVYHAHVQEMVRALHALADFFSGRLQSEKSVREGVNALFNEKKSFEILNRIERNPEISAMIGARYQGLATDQESLRATFEWGRSIATCGLSRDLFLNILNKDGDDLLVDVIRIVDNTLSAFANVRNALSKLGQFGEFSLAQWQQQSEIGIEKTAPKQIKRRLEIAFDNLPGLFSWSKYLAARAACPQDGLRLLVAAMEAGDIEPDKLGMAVEFVGYNTIAKSTYRKFPELARFNGLSHDSIRQDYQKLDKEMIDLRGKDLAFQIDKQKRPPMGHKGPYAKDYTEMELILREINKTRRHIPIRQLLKRAGRAVQELKPCFMMGPLSVAQYLDPESLKFDIVIMDEASQLKPEEAIGAVARGAQLVVVGDAKQLPPTNFFDRMLESGEEEDEGEVPAIQGMESILDICQQLFSPTRSLRWHYRSQHDSLIAFSNFHFYKNLVVFPSPFRRSGSLGVRYHYVRNGAYQNRQNIPEAQKVVDLVCEHMIKHPEESLGVVTLNQSQRDLIEELLDRRLRVFSEGDEYLRRHREDGWPFFVKNLENVQGDERDVIMISTTFGKAPGASRPRQNFGPISRETGWRRLNVLFTRARRRIHLFTSMTSEDIILDEKTPIGTKALRDYLDFAKKGILAETGFTSREPDSDFELAVADLLRDKGYTVTPQFGVAGFFIDMVVHNPDRPGHLMAAIECDGATYHSGASVRDRDRIRQEILESLGWKNRIWRIWSTDWFTNPRIEAQRLFEFLDRCRLMVGPDQELEYEPEVEEVEDEQVEVQGLALDREVTEALSINDVEDIFVEVGDRVTYSFKDKPDVKYTVWITDGPSNPDMKMVNENAPIAVPLLGLSVGEEDDFEIPGQPTRVVRVMKIDKA